MLLCSVAMAGDLPGDFDGDGIVNMYDLTELRRCLWGPAVEVSWAPCVPTDLTGDVHVDLMDVSVFQRSFDSGDMCTPQWGPAISGIPGIYGRVYAMIVHEGALIIGGELYSAGTQRLAFVARWDGHSWLAMGDDLLDTVRAFAVFDDGNGPALYAGGTFNGNGAIARWNGDRWTYLVTGFYGTSGINQINALAVYDDGSGPALFVGGNFTNLQELDVNRIAKWNGSSWSEVGAGLSADVFALQVYDDGQGPALYAGGAFSTAGVAGALRIAKWDGTSWSALTGSNVADIGSRVNALTVFDDGAGPALFVGGRFAVSRWDGVNWSRVGQGMNSDVTALGTFDDGSGPKLYAGGGFNIADGSEALMIARWNGDSWGGLISGPYDGEVSPAIIHALATFNSETGPTLYVGGDFVSIGSETASDVARWSGGSWSALNTGIGGVYPTFRTLDVIDLGNGPELYAGGRFRTNGNGTAVNIAKFSEGGWLPLGGRIETDRLDEEHVPVRAITAFDDGAGPAIYAAGEFEQAGGISANNIAKWNGQEWTALGAGLRLSGNPLPAAAYSLVSFDDGSGPALYVGGSFGTAGDTPAQNIARWTGSTWEGVGAGVSSAVRAMAVYDDGTGPMLVAACHFTMAGGVPASRVAKWDGTAWSPLGDGISGAVYALKVLDDGSGPALFAGSPSYIGADRGVSKWDGNSWVALGTGFDGGYFSTAFIHDLAVFDDGAGPTLFACGSFTFAGEYSAWFIARWNGGAWVPLGSVLNGSGVGDVAYALEVFDVGSGPELLVGGSFSDAGSDVSQSIARWSRPALPCPP